MLAIWILFSLLHATAGQEARTKLFCIHSDSMKDGLLECIASCLENECGAVSMTDGRCSEFSREEWHPEMNLDASETVSLDIYVLHVLHTRHLLCVTSNIKLPPYLNIPECPL